VFCWLGRMKLEELRLSDVTTWFETYMKFIPGHFPRLSLLAYCKTYRSAYRKSQHRSTYLLGNIVTFSRFETDDLTLDAKYFLQPSWHALIEFLACANVDAFAVWTMFEGNHHQNILFKSRDTYLSMLVFEIKQMIACHIILSFFST